MLLTSSSSPSSPSSSPVRGGSSLSADKATSPLQKAARRTLLGVRLLPLMLVLVLLVLVLVLLLLLELLLLQLQLIPRVGSRCGCRPRARAATRAAASTELACCRYIRIPAVNS